MSYNTFVKSSSNAFRALPNTDTLLQSAELSEVIDVYGRNAVKAAIREELEYLRAEISDNNSAVINQVLQEIFWDNLWKNSKSPKSTADNTLIPVTTDRHSYSYKFRPSKIARESRGGDEPCRKQSLKSRI